MQWGYMGISFGDLYGSHCITPPVMDDTGYPWTRMNIELIYIYISS